MADAGNDTLRRIALPGISRSLQVIAVVVFVLIAGATADQLFETRVTLLADTEHTMARLDMVFAEQTGRAIETVDLIVRNVIDGVRAGTVVPTAGADEGLRRRIAGVRQMSEVAAADASGRVTASSATDSGTMLPAAGMTLLEWHRAHTADELQISEPMRAGDGKWTALLSRRVNAPDGGFAGIVVAYLNLAYFEDFYRAVELNENGAIMLHRRDGTVLARYPPNDSVVGLSYAALPPFRDILSHDMAGTVVMDSPLDGSRRVLAIRALKAFPLAVNISVDENMVLKQWRRQTVVFAVAALGAAIAIGLLLILLAQRSGRIEILLGETAVAKDAAERANAQLLQQMEERERAEAALRQAQRMEAIGQLTGGVAHDFNNLLTVVIGNIDLLQLTGDLGREANERLATMRAAAERGAALTVQLLAFARRQPLVPREIDLNAVVSDMNDLLQSALGSRVRIEPKLDPALWRAMVDPTQIELVILNLAINGRDAMPGGGTLTIATRNVVLPPPEREDAPPAGEYVMIAVTDTGFGMSLDVLAKAFEPFFTTKPPGAGSGLGLSQVFGLARQSGGGVQIESKPGQGTTVRVHLPRAPARIDVRTAAAPSVPQPRASRAVVMVVDDDDAVRATIAGILTTLGYTVVQAEGGISALHALRGGVRADLLLTDVAMPDMAGPEVARRARELRPNLPIVFISGYADPESIVGDMRLARLIRKPFRPNELATQIEAALAEPVVVV